MNRDLLIPAIALCLAAPAPAQMFGEPVYISEMPPQTRILLACDLDGDSFEDLVYPGTGLAVMLNRGEGFLPPIELSFPVRLPRGADFDGDGLDDIITGEEGPVLFSNGDGTFTESAYTVLEDAAPADIDGNAMPDLLMADGQFFHVCLNQDWGDTFPVVFTGAVPDQPGNAAFGFFTGDIGGDSFVDIGVIHRYGLSVFIAQGGWTLYSSQFSENLWGGVLSSPCPYSQCDVDDNGHPDLAFSNWTTSSIYDFACIPVWEDSPGMWYYYPEYIDAGWHAVLDSGDFDQDGFDDIAAKEWGEVTVRPGGPESLGGIVFSDDSRSWEGVCACDVDGDGYPDILATDYSSLYWLPNQCMTAGEEGRDPVVPAVSASPNPFTSVVTLTTGVPGTEYSVFDQAGRKLAELSGEESTWAPSGLPSGLYLVQACAYGSTTTCTLVKLP